MDLNAQFIDAVRRNYVELMKDSDNFPQMREKIDTISAKSRETYTRLESGLDVGNGVPLEQFNQIHATLQQTLVDKEDISLLIKELSNSAGSIEEEDLASAVEIVFGDPLDEVVDRMIGGSETGGNPDAWRKKCIRFVRGLLDVYG